MARFVRVRRADPELVVAGGILWLLSLPFFGLIALVVLHPLRAFADCFDQCAPLPSVVEVVGLPALVWSFATVTLIALALLARRRPRLGFLAFGAIGAAIILWIGVVVIAAAQPLAALILFAWPGWSAIAFVDAAWRARRSPASS